MSGLFLGLATTFGIMAICTGQADMRGAALTLAIMAGVSVFYASVLKED